MGFSWQTGEDVSTGGSFLEEPGTYHVAITAVDEEVTKRDGSLVDNAAFRIHLEVCDGTAPGQKGKTKDLIFFHPKASQKNEGEFARKKIDRLFLAANLLKLDQLGKAVEFDLQDMVGMNLVMKFEKDKDGKYVDLAFCDIFHIDDPFVAGIPKSAEALNVVPQQFRGAAGRVLNADKAAGGSNGKGGSNGNGKTATKPTVDLASVDI